MCFLLDAGELGFSTGLFLAWPQSSHLQDKMLQEAVTIWCAHGDNALYPLAMVDLVVGGVPLSGETAVSTTLPVSILLGSMYLN